MFRELALLAALLTVSAAAARQRADDTMMELAAEFQGGNYLEGSEKFPTGISVDDETRYEDEQLREVLFAMVVKYLQQNERKLNDYETSEISSMSKSPYIGVMRAYLARKYLSSSSFLTQEELHAAGLSCSLCEKAVGWAIPKITKWGCGFFFDTAATAFCNAIGFGPEDPMTWACTAVLIGSCTVILGQIEKHITNPTAICETLKAC